MPDLEDLFGRAYELRLPILVATIVGAIVLLIAAALGRWDRVARRHPRGMAAGAVLLLVVALPATWYLASPLVLSTELIEPEPAAVVGSAAPSVPGVTLSPGPGSARPASASPPTAGEPTPSASSSAEPSIAGASPAAATETRGSFSGTDDFHFGRGTARLIVAADGSAILRLEKFAVRNGPDLFVYLSPNAGRYTKDAVELGRLKADRGSFNYKIPAGTDLSRVKSAVIWCKQFSFQFAVAPLS